jgi:hypothetical protein
MEITELPPTPLVLPVTGELVHMQTQEWALERWEGEDPPGLAGPWARKPKFSVNGSRSCAELAIVHHLRAGGWDGIWVNAFRGELRTQWFPAPGARRLAEVGAPGWAVDVFECLRTANGGTLSGFFDVFASREPGRAGFFEAKGRAGPDQAHSAQVHRDRTALPQPGGVHDRRDRRALPANDAGPPTRDRRGPACNAAAGDDRAAFRPPGPAASAALAGPDRARSWHLSGAAVSAHDAVDRGRGDQGGRVVRR